MDLTGVVFGACKAHPLQPATKPSSWLAALPHGTPRQARRAARLLRAPHLLG